MSDHNKIESCPCCKNPWAAATGEMFAKFCGTCEETKKDEEKPADSSNKFGVDSTISPSEDFYLYANKKWMDENPIPKGYPSWNTFLHLHNLSQERLKDLLQDLNEKGVEDASDDTMKLAAFYAAAMDEETIEQAGTEPIQPLLAACKRAANAASDGDASALASSLGELVYTYGISSFFSIGASPDNNNSDHSIAQVAQGGIGLPDRDYYFDEDKDDKRVAYKKHLAKMLTLIEDPLAESPSEESIANAEKVYELEEKMAKAHMTKTENRDPEVTYNKMSIADFSTNVCKDTFDFESYFKAATGKSVEEIGDINIRNLAALECATELANSVDAEVLEQYLRFRSVASFAKYMSKAFVMESFDFNEKTLSGTDEIKPRWKRAMAFTESALGEALGQIYCAKYFDESCKEKALFIVESVRKALEERLKEVDWMQSDSTREQALKKMNRFNVKIGYPDEWIDYSPLNIVAGESFLSMIFKSRHFDHLQEIKEMNAPTDKKKWFMTPQTINAYYHPSLNEIVFPAAILQAPMFDPDADVAVNFGAIGAVVGHEMTHGFDDKGRKFNFEGNMVDWWTKDDAEEYEKRVDVMVEQANAVEIHGQNLKGKLTCGENIADLGGLHLALRALMSQPNFDIKETIDGFNPIQRFFIGWANCWRQNITKERALQLLTLDPHGPNPMRCNGPLSNMAEFHKAFNVSEDSPMFRKKEQRVDIW
jgi:putative endopeptidase